MSLIEINYSPRRGGGSEIAAILAPRRPARHPQQPQDGAGGQTKGASRASAMLSPPLLLLQLINFKVIMLH